MAKFPRVLGRAAAIASALVAAALVLCLDGVDYQPYFVSEYYTRTLQRLDAADAEVVKGELAAGFGKALLSPSLNAAADDPARGQFRSLPLAGYGNRKGRPATGVHDDLYVKAVVMSVAGKTGVVVSADALIVPREIAEASVERLSRELHLGRGQIYFSATHTHAGLGGWGEGIVAEAFAGGFQPGIRTWWVDRIVAAVRSAVSDVGPAALGHGRLALPQYVRNRLVKEAGQVDGDFSYLVIKKAGGPLSVIGSYAAHATVLPASNMEFSGDYPGAWQRAVEEATGGTAIFLAGAVGSHGPLAGAPGYEGAQRMGAALASAVLDALPRTPLTNHISLGMCALSVALPPLNARVTDSLRLRPWLAGRLLPVGADVMLQAFRFGNEVWISTPCDFSGELALGIKDAFYRRGIGINVTSFNGDYIGYVVRSRYYHLPGYEPRVMSFFGPNVPDYLDDLMRRLAARITVDAPPLEARQSKLDLSKPRASTAVQF